MKEFLTYLRREARNRLLLTARLCESCGQVSTEAGRHQLAVDRLGRSRRDTGKE
jgi:hypothetical protein